MQSDILQTECINALQKWKCSCIFFQTKKNKVSPHISKDLTTAFPFPEFDIFCKHRIHQVKEDKMKRCYLVFHNISARRGAV